MKLFTLLCSLLLAGVSLGQTCTCTYSITTTGSYDGTTLGIGPGSTVCIKAGSYAFLRLNNFTGSSSNPITFVNCGGLVDVNASTGSTGIAFQGCRYFRVTGTGDGNYPYGIRISQTGNGISGLHITSKSSDCEVDHIESFNTGFAGIMIKTDPNCDPSTQRGNFTMYNVYVHHNYVHDTTGEGFYIGNSFWNNGQTITCNGQSQTVYPHEIVGLEISYNRAENTHCEGIQYACAANSRVHHNMVMNAGILPFDQFQDNGVQIGGGVSGPFYNNTIRQARGVGLIVVGHLGPNTVYNNLITNAGESGIFVDERTGSLPNVDMVFANNTIVTPTGAGVQLSNETQKNYLINNVAVNVGNGQYVITNSVTNLTAPNNFTAATVAAAKFVDAANGDYRLAAGSPLINAGQDVSRYGIVTDLADISRPQGVAYDIGAYEYQETALPVTLVSFTAKAQGNRIQLAWETTRERNADYFEVQRSADLREFGSIGQLPANGTTNGPQYYGLPDERPLDGINYYRLKQVDTNGQVAYSKVVSAVLDEQTPSLEVLGNPVEGQSIRVAVRNLAGASYQLCTLTGQPVSLSRQVLADGSLLLIPFQVLPAGVYLVKAGVENRQLVQKIIVR